MRSLQAAGLDAVEPNCPSIEDLETAPAIIDACGLAVSALPSGRLHRGEGVCERLAALATVAVRRRTPLIIGLIRGDAATPRPVSTAFVQGIAQTLLPRHPDLLELITTAEAAWPNTLADGAACLAGLGHPDRIRLLADTYHLARSGELDHLDRHRAVIGHLHLAGPCREPPEDQPGLAEALRWARRHGLPVGFELAENAATHAAICGAWARRIT